jgi:UDP-N-acetyl-D-galactosamine dehydrogenase
VIDVYDPWVSADEVKSHYDVSLVDAPGFGTYDAILLAVRHDQIVAMSEDTLRSFGKQGHVLYDLKNILPRGQSDLRL